MPNKWMQFGGKAISLLFVRQRREKKRRADALSKGVRYVDPRSFIFIVRRKKTAKKVTKKEYDHLTLVLPPQLVDLATDYAEGDLTAQDVVRRLLPVKSWIVLARHDMDSNDTDDLDLPDFLMDSIREAALKAAKEIDDGVD